MLDLKAMSIVATWRWSRVKWEADRGPGLDLELPMAPVRVRGGAVPPDGPTGVDSSLRPPKIGSVSCSTGLTGWSD